MRATFQMLVIVAAIVGLGAGAAFAGGVVYGRQSTPEPAATTQTPAASPAAGGGGTLRTTGGQGSAGGQPTAGTVEQVTGDTVTVRTQAGGTVEVKLTPETQVTKQAPATAEDVQPGTQVVISGQPDTDGKIAARSVQIGAGGPAPDASPAATQSP